MRRLIKVAGVLVSVVIIASVAIVGIAVRTEFGRERVRRLALQQLAGVVNGRMQVDRIDGNLLGRFTLVGVSIVDSAGAPFVQADTLSARVAWALLLDQRVRLSDIALRGADITLDQDADGRWNYERIFPSDTTARDTTPGWGDWVTLDDVEIRRGRLHVVRPWSPEGTPAVRDSLTRVALSDSSTLRIQKRGDGYVQLLTLDQISAVVPRARIADPDEVDMQFDVDSMRALVAMYRPAPLDVRQLAGSFRVGPDSIWAPSLEFALPDTRGSGRLSIDGATGDIHAAVDVPRVAFADLRPLYAALPDSGGGRLNAVIVVRDSTPSDYTVTDADIAVGASTLRGRIALTVGDSLVHFGDSRLEFARVRSELVQRFVPDVEMPLSGAVSGVMQMSGPLEAMQVDLRAEVRPDRHAAFSVSARGGAGVGEGFMARRLRVSGDRVPLSLARAFDVEQPIGGVITASGTLDGSTTQLMSGVIDLRHDERGEVSRATVRGTIAVEDSLRMNMSARLHTVALTLARHFADSLDIQGAVSGDVGVRGTPDNLSAQLALSLPEDGRMSAQATYHKPANDSARYTAEVTVQNVAPHAMLPSLPVMLLDGTASVDGRNLSLAAANATLQSRLALFMIDSAEVRDIVLNARTERGVLTVDTLGGSTSFGGLMVRGAFGLTESTEGALEYAAHVDDLRGLTRWIATGDTTPVAARPAVGERAARFRARMDSIRTAMREQEDPAAALAAAMRDTLPRRRTASIDIPPVARDSTSGSFTVAGTARGNIDHARVTAEVKTPGVVWDGNLFGAGTVRAEWRGAFTETDTILVEGGIDSVRVAGFAFDSTHFKGRSRGGEGNVVMSLYPGDTAAYRFDTDFALRTGEGELRLRDVDIRLDSTHWRSTRPSVISWREQGLQIDSLDLRDERAGSRLLVHGEIPDADPGRLEVVAENVRIGPWLTISQSDVKADGLLSSTLTLEGTKSAPTLDGSVRLSNMQYEATPFPDLEATLRYAARELAVDAQARNAAGLQLAQVTGTVPIDLALDSVAERLPKSGQLALKLTGDSIPMAPIAELTDAVSDVSGVARADVTIGGTWETPELGGTAGLDLAQVRLEATGVTLRNVAGRLRMSVDTIIVDSLSAQSGGRLVGSGSILLSPMDNPTLQLTMRAADARVLNNEQGELFADGTIRASGPLDSLAVTGNVAIVRGVIYIPDPAQFDVIDTQDPAIFAVTDTATAEALGISTGSAAAQNLRLDVGVDVRRGTFGRSAEANVEVYGNLRVRTEPPGDAFLVTGSLYTDRGYYTIYGKRFDVNRGSVRFVGGETINPSLQLLATYEIQQAGRAPLDIRVVIGGTVEKPTISLESDAQPTLSQSDLISFLAFGRSSSSLLQFSGTGLEGGGAGGSSLAGNVAALATRQLASIGIGALVDEVRSDIASATRADVLNITPAQLPADVDLGALETVLRGTEIEIGRYLNERTFVLGRVRPSLLFPGATIEHRLNERLRARASLETRLQATTPTLGRGVEPRTLQVVGALLTWTLAW